MIGNVVKFDKEEFNFDLLVMDALRSVDEFRPLKSLEDLHHFALPDDIPRIEKIIYELFRAEKFSSKYGMLCERLIADMFECGASYQKIPSVRIHMPKMKSVNFHTDTWYGHGEKIKNFWLPLMKVDGSMSLAILSDEDNDSLLSIFKDKQPSIIEINQACEGKYKFLDLDFGEIFYFHSRLLHGTFCNEGARTRVSFDFRMRLDGDSAGVKDDSFFTHPFKK